MNKAHFKNVLDQITAHPETWKQATWHCGTQHCFAGWAQLLSGRSADTTTVRRDARIYLDLSLAEANWLFASDATMKNFTQFLTGRDGYSRDGYSRDGYSRDGYNQDGYNRDGYNRDGYDQDGYDQDGLDGHNRPRTDKEDRP